MVFKNALLKDTDACIVVSKTNRFYLCGYTTSNGILVLTKKSGYFLTDFRYKEEALKILKPEGFTVLEYKAEELKQILNDILRSEKVKSIGIEEDMLYPAYKKMTENLEGFDVKNISTILNEMRSVKTEKEIETIKYAQSINDKTLRQIKSIIKPGISERDLSIELKYRLLKNGADDFSFEPVVAFGKNTSKPHCLLSNKKLKTGEPIMLDFGAKYNGYCSDMTRMLCLGKPSGEVTACYELVLKAQTAALEYIKNKVPVRETDLVVRGIFAAENCETNFGHGLGHGVGLDIHESPNVKNISEDMFKTGMVVTVEPGLYFADKFGIRVEDLVIVTDSGIENLTKSSKELIIDN